MLSEGKKLHSMWGIISDNFEESGAPVDLKPVWAFVLIARFKISVEMFLIKFTVS